MRLVTKLEKPVLPTGWCARVPESIHLLLRLLWLIQEWRCLLLIFRYKFQAREEDSSDSEVAREGLETGAGHYADDYSCALFACFFAVAVWSESSFRRVLCCLRLVPAVTMAAPTSLAVCTRTSDQRGSPIRSWFVTFRPASGLP